MPAMPLIQPFRFPVTAVPGIYFAPAQPALHGVPRRLGLPRRSSFAPRTGVLFVAFSDAAATLRELLLDVGLKIAHVDVAAADAGMFAFSLPAPLTAYQAYAFEVSSSVESFSHSFSSAVSSPRLRSM